ncbi:hypothetical protein Q2T42_31010 [Leptolyngbya boryana CZ1]|uniref:Uncharacterized protein n=1 Tax=Leptolyngbya boryana CZ1 TaxID=3060204 RepID=A0AA96WY21_LEPBY|nr:hypothetical protein [Leptolyngbya boryana]WNZ46219.1 hypothetical protein Q2T42_31010 [Leptolyngbya boryana CZ1]
MSNWRGSEPTQRYLRKAEVWEWKAILRSDSSSEYSTRRSHQ